ncbi:MULTISPECIES: hypothetical protein [Caldilinea]|jgi:hypothetical protein|uniref:WD40 repeat domain-containing protein n=1 Tax=Caldilinea aerophila (strain DSM 14535 / JCM 11387 / NBRC 104270 / STL-6-O1) TaxID=926550 RepID=I0I9J5_CALAS|nr:MULTISPECIES: hypothetical protein [Caldilinea]BAM01933.1 hypothetical protein CLDAP_38930 [Caldilinea aerophila DSM 14535 = NBRC 104270]GIV75136.1 MAG: hypothetical protein KatS3mg049_3692 [Caldilinea sp.]
MDDLRRVHRAGLAAGGRVLFWYNAAIRSLALSCDGRLLACGDAAGRVRIFDWMLQAREGRSCSAPYNATIGRGGKFFTPIQRRHAFNQHKIG